MNRFFNIRPILTLTSFNPSTSRFLKGDIIPADNEYGTPKEEDPRSYDALY